MLGCLLYYILLLSLIFFDIIVSCMLFC